MDGMAQTGADDLNLDRLNDEDKVKLRQFLANEQQRSQIQSQTHSLTEKCWKRCVTGSIKNANLDRSEQTCLDNCVSSFLEMNLLTMKHLQSMRST
ncbi:hypothetical protein CDD83_6572 [Cordyceps sp. RAO-2017]|nr:hypothetical protein CDD83_6572 [Cordyceps sp. RAO-2017]